MADDSKRIYGSILYEANIHVDDKTMKELQKLCEEHEGKAKTLEKELEMKVDAKVDEMFENTAFSFADIALFKDIANQFFKTGWNECYKYHEKFINQ